jgi:hypothetical protein
VKSKILSPNDTLTFRSLYKNEMKYKIYKDDIKYVVSGILTETFSEDLELYRLQTVSQFLQKNKV